MDITKVFGDILSGNIPAAFIVVLLIGFVRVAGMFIAEKDKRFGDSQVYNEKITELNKSLTKLEQDNQESNDKLIAKIDGFMNGKK